MIGTSISIEPDDPEGILYPSISVCFYTDNYREFSTNETTPNITSMLFSVAYGQNDWDDEESIRNIEILENRDTNAMKPTLNRELASYLYWKLKNIFLAPIT